MACSCRSNRSFSLSTAIGLTDVSALFEVDPMTATIDLPASLTSNNGSSSSPAPLSSTTCRQRFCVRRCPVRQRLELSGRLIGLPVPADISVSYTIQEMPGAAITDADGRYTLEAFPCESVVITAPVQPGYVAMPAQYTFAPVCYARQNLDFTYTPTSGVFSLALASRELPPYSLPPNAWPVNGDDGQPLAMLERILVSLSGSPLVVKYAPGSHNEGYFAENGTDITASWQAGIPVAVNGLYTVYAAFSDGTAELGEIDVNTLRDGSSARPWLLLNFDTAIQQENLIPGAGQFTLFYMQGGENKLSQYYELYEDINMAGQAWTPLGNITPAFPVVYDSFFTGGLDGAGHVIDHLLPANADGSVKAFFAGIGGGASIRNITLDHYYVASQNDYTLEILGGFAAVAYVRDGRAILFDHCRVNGSLNSSSIFGLAAFISYATLVNAPVTITNSQVSMTINGQDETGGFVGYFSCTAGGSLHFADCATFGSISGLQQIGGYAGGWNSTELPNTIIRCVNQMSVTATSFYAGGFAGTIYSAGANAQFLFSSCYNGGDVTGAEQVGGILGRFGASIQPDALGLRLEDCFNTGTIMVVNDAGSDSYLGGLIGETEGPSVILHCYSTGTVSNATPQSEQGYAGGLAGTYATLQYSAALGLSVSAGLPFVARIAAGAESSLEAVLAQNLAWEGMQVLIGGMPKTPLDEGANLPDGEGRSAAELKQQSTYEAELGWDFQTVWQFGNGDYTLPVLRGIPLDLQPIVLPAQLTEPL